MAAAQLPTTFDVYDNSLKQASEHRQVLIHELEDAQLALANAQLRIATIENDIRDLDTVCAVLEGAVQDHKRKKAQQIMRTMPEDVLRMIFVQLTSMLHEPLPDCRYLARHNATRAAVPYVLSAVCQRWRGLALGTPALWTYIGMTAPDSTKASDRALTYVSTNVSRSAPLPVDISMEAPSDDDRVPVVALENIMLTLAGCAPRWRSVFLHLDYRCQYHPEWNYLRFPSPLLEELDIRGSAVGEYDDGPPVLSHSTRFRRFVSEVRDIIWEHDSESTLVHLVYAHLRLDCLPIRTLWDALGKTPNLKRLEVICLDEESSLPDSDASIPPPTLELPALLHLSFLPNSIDRLAEWSDYLTVPKLSTLEISIANTNTEVGMHKFCQRFAQTSSVTSLKLRLSKRLKLKLSDIRIVASLSKVRRFAVGLEDRDDLEDGDDNNVPIQADVFALIVTEQFWPALESLSFASVHLDDFAAEALVALVKSRNLRLMNPDDRDGSIARITSVTFEPQTCRIPFWLSDRVAHYLHEYE